MGSEATITNVTVKLQKKKKSGYDEDKYNRNLYSHVNLMLHVFSEPHFLILEANFKMLKFKGLSQLTHFI